MNTITLSAEQFTQIAVKSIKCVPPGMWSMHISAFSSDSKKTVEDVAEWVVKDIGATIEIHKKALRRIILAILLYETQCQIPTTTTDKLRTPARRPSLRK